MKHLIHTGASFFTMLMVIILSMIISGIGNIFGFCLPLNLQFGVPPGNDKQHFQEL